MTRRYLIKYLPAVYAAAAFPQTLRRTHTFWVLNLLSPTILNVRANGSARVHCFDSQSGSVILEGGSVLSVAAQRGGEIHLGGLDSSPVGFTLEVPGILERAYLGSCDIDATRGALTAVVRMDTETAVGSIVGAELPVAAAAFHAMAAQAVATRSVLLGSVVPRHPVADFCDTTHCQFLRSPAPLGSVLKASVQETAATVLVQNGAVMPARYSAACGGKTESAQGEQFDYLAVNCEVCRQLGLVRRGHGLGLCQEGAMGLAQRGWRWEQILALYYPNTSLLRVTV